MFDHLNQMIIIFYLDTIDAGINLQESYDMTEVKNTLDKQNILIEISKKKRNTILVTIPSFRQA